MWAVYPHGRNGEEFHQMVDLGMKSIDALRAGTSVDAELLGLADKIGSRKRVSQLISLLFPAIRCRIYGRRSMVGFL